MKKPLFGGGDIRSLYSALGAGVLMLGVAACGASTPSEKAEAESAPASEAALAERPRAKYEPAGDKILVFVGQDNESVGGQEKWTDGYVDHFGMPAGVSHYIYFTEGKTNPFGGSFDVGTVDGLNKETEWAAGPMCLRCYLESPKFSNSVVHLAISMEHDDEPSVAAGDYDHNIEELAAFMKEHSEFPFLLRIGYEFDGFWNSYEPEPFKQAWRRIVDKLHERGVTNFATVLASYRQDIPDDVWETYWPGDEYVDWLGYSYWAGGTYSDKIFEYAREKGKPVFIAEATARGYMFENTAGTPWNDWFRFFFQTIEENKDVVKAIHYINANWQAQNMWRDRGWGDTRIQVNEHTTENWVEKMKDERYVHTTEGVYELIGFNPSEE